MWLWRCSYPDDTLSPQWGMLGSEGVTLAGSPPRAGHQPGASPTVCIRPQQCKGFVAFCHFHVGNWGSKG